MKSCPFDKIGRGGLRPFFDWIAENSESTSLWRIKLNKVDITTSLLDGMEFFIYVIPLIEPRIYFLGVMHPPPAVAYSDAEWTMQELPLLPRRGLGGCIFLNGKYKACSVDAPMDTIDQLANRHTQIIPIEFIAEACSPPLRSTCPVRR